jgi:hypothetical protein
VLPVLAVLLIVWLLLPLNLANSSLNWAVEIGRNLILSILVLLLGVGIIVVLRTIGAFPSELDRIGSDLNLYGYGIALSFMIGVQLNRPVLSWVGPPQRTTLFIGTALLLTYVLYGLNLFLSEQIRNVDRERYERGVNSVEDFFAILAQPRGARLIRWSLSIGFFPTLSMILADLVSH